MEFYEYVAPVMMVALLVVFVAIILWTYWPRSKARFERDGEIPLRDGE
jgi:cbb3-type cytochrome oxidase subunit 3